MKIVLKRKVQRFISALLAVVLALGVVPQLGFTVETSAATISGVAPTVGTGTAADPYQIATAENLVWFAGVVNGNRSIIGSTAKNAAACAILTADITLNTGVLDANGGLVSDTSGLFMWTAMATYEAQYAGTFDGANHTISGLYINDSSQTEGGLFTYVSSSGTVKNVNIADSYVTSGYSSGSVCATSKGSITNCSNSGTVTLTQYGSYAGGICGTNESGGRVTNCVNSGKIIGNGDYAGGIVGYTYCATMTSCLNVGVVTATKAGAICGLSDGSSSNITKCYYMEGTASVGVFKDNNSSVVTAKSEADCKSGAVAYIMNGSTSTGTLIWYQNIGVDDYPVPNSTHGIVYLGGGYNLNGFKVDADYSNIPDTSGASLPYQPAKTNAEGVYEIGNAGNLMWFAGFVNGDSSLTGSTTKNVSANAILTADITLNTGVVDTEGKLASDTSEFIEWTAMAYEKGNILNHYSGTFDGANHTISGLYRGATSDVCGLFGVVAEGGAVKNVNIINSYISGSYYVGGVCAYNKGTISSCSSSATIIGTTSYDVGGICGYTQGTISNCYNDGAITGKSYTGGICGGNGGFYEIVNCSNTGAIASTKAGAICAYIVNPVICVTNCYYLKGTADLGVYLTNGSTEIFEKTETEYNSGEVAYLLNGSTSTGTLNWYQNIDEDDYPVLDTTHGIVYGKNGYSANGVLVTAGYSNMPSTAVLPYQPASISAEGVYQIANAGNLMWFAGLVNGDSSIVGDTAQNLSASAVLTADITLNTDVIDKDGILANDTSGFVVWTPIGSDTNEYAGSFDGAGYTINGLYVNDTSKRYAGLFGYANTGGIIKNVNVANSYLQGNTSVGGVCGFNYADITNCSNSSTIVGTSSVGGVCGYNFNKVNACYNSGIVNANSEVGGVCGYNSANISDCYNAGTITGTDYSGGVCGYNYTHCSIANCSNTGTITGTNYSGGVCGFNNTNGSIANCSNTGTMTNTTSMGAICGENYDTTGIITNCYYLKGTADSGVYMDNAEGTDVIEKNETEYKSGEVAYLLNGSVSTGTLNWYQTIGEDDYPVMDKTHGTVYYGSTYNANGFLVDKVYNNVGNATMPYQEPKTDTEGVYQIANAGNFMWFAGLVNGDSGIIGDTAQNLSASAVLTADITLNTGVLDKNGELAEDTSGFIAWTPIAQLSDAQYSGTFDGGNYAIRGLYYNDSSKSYIGLFGYIGESGIVKNVDILDSYILAGTYIGGVSAVNNGTIANCSNGTKITVEFGAGGISCGNKGSITNCYNSGTITATSQSAMVNGGICGWIIDANITNCSNTGAIDAAQGGAICGDSMSSTITNCYYMTGTASSGVYEMSSVDGINSVEKTEAEYSSGEVAYLLNGSISTGTLNWYQTLGEDAYPVLDTTHGTVYYGSGYTTNGILVETMYSNIDNAETSLYQAPQADTEGVYQIANTGNLMWFAGLVNGDSTIIGDTAQNISASAVLTANIDLAGMAWTALSSYSGTIDGNGYTVSNMSLGRGNETRDAFVCNLNAGGMIENIIFDKADVFKHDGKSSGVIVRINSGTIQNSLVTNSSVYLGNYAGLGGIAGRSSGTIKNCGVINTGLHRVYGGTSRQAMGGITQTNTGTVENCFAYGVVLDKGSSRGGIIDAGTAAVNSYYYTGSTVTADTAVDGVAKTVDEFKSGEVAYLLNGSTNTGIFTWYQTLGTDDYPVLDTAHGSVYRYGSYNENGVFIDTAYIYSNSGTAGLPYQIPQADENGVYQIANAGNLMWFAGLVNGDSSIIGDMNRNTSASAVLTADITLNTGVIDENGDLAEDTSGFVEWTPIGTTTYKYNGSFDGANYSINGLYFNDSSKSVAGLFCAIDSGATLKNIEVANSYIEAMGYVGGICGSKWDGSIDNCSNSSTIVGEQFVGGISGTNMGGSITNCLNSGKIVSIDSAGGICCTNNGKVENCSNTGKVTGTCNAAIVSLAENNKNVIIKNNYYLAGTADSRVGDIDSDIALGAFEKTEAQYNSGEVTYLLNGSTSTGTLAWGQTIGTDSYPILGGAKVYKTANDAYINESLGDVNNSGAIDSVDATLILKLISGIMTKDSFSASYNYDAADYNQDGNVDLLDVIAIEQAGI